MNAFHNIIKQVNKDTQVKKGEEHVCVEFPEEGLKFKFKYTRGVIHLEDKSHAIIAGVTGKLMVFDSREIASTNKIFDWLGVKYDVNYSISTRVSEYALQNGIISFF